MTTTLDYGPHTPRGLCALERRKRRGILTTGEIASLCSVAPRTVSKWFDSGKLKGYRIPGSRDRRVPRDELIRFMVEVGMPLGPLARYVGRRVLMVTADSMFADRLTDALPKDGDYSLDVCPDPGIGLGFALADACHPAIVLDWSCGATDCTRAARAVWDRRELRDTKIIALLGEDSGGLAPVGVHYSFLRPCDPAEIARCIEDIFAPESRTYHEVER